MYIYMYTDNVVDMYHEVYIYRVFINMYNADAQVVDIYMIYICIYYVFIDVSVMIYIYIYIYICTIN